MKRDKALGLLKSNAQRIEQFADNVTEAQAKWRPDEASWSILEVITHLLDEEREDFRVRLDITLHQADGEWPPIDPTGWVTARNYNDRILQDSLSGFMSEREASLKWLASLDNPNWQAETQTPWGGMSAGDMLASWVAHDLLHLRQLVELHYQYWLAETRPYQVRYAGEW